MKTRIISALVGLILLILVMFTNNLVFGIVVFALSIIGINEMFNAFINAGKKPIKIIGYLSCLPLLSLSFNNILKGDSFFNINLLFLFAFILFLSGLFVIVFKFEKYDYLDISLTYFAIIYVVFLFSFIILTRNLENGKYYIWLIFIGAWLTDSAAYFTGSFVGKNKIIPVVSPKKTVEGTIGGVIGCVIIMLLYGIFVVNKINEIAFYHFIILGLISGIVSQIGDWAASAIKRKADIKDYGSLMPGHGGIIDRFDSILIIAPVVYFYITIIIF
ncbi:MAG: phosphatidate cytidylyltransferase [Clostridiales bacterium]